MTDISKIVPAARQIDIKHPVTGEPIGLKVTLLPPSSEKVQAVQRAQINERLQRNNKVAPADRMEANNLALLEAAVAGWEWEGDLKFEGEKPTLNPANLRRVLKQLKWVRTQIDMELGDEAAFFTSSEAA